MAKEFGILWDYNGVIVDDEHLQAKSLAIALKNYGVTLTHDLYLRHVLGRPDRAVVETLKGMFTEISGIPTEKLVNEKIDAYQILIQNESILAPGLKEVLAAFNDGYAMVIVTGSTRSEVEPILEAENIAHFFQRIVPADEITRGKPNPEGYVKGAQYLNLSPEKIIVIEDTPVGIQAAHNAGLKCIAVCQTLPPEKLGQADKVIEGVKDLTTEVISQVLTRK